jgi:hypothetical protein
MKKLLEEIKVTVSLAVRLIDDFSAEKPVGKLSISLKDEDYKPVRTAPDRFVFLDLPKAPSDKYTVQVESEFYFYDNSSQGNIVTLSSLPSLNPSVELHLKPKPAYPYPAGTTLIRGFVVSKTSKKPVAGAVVEVVEQAASKKVSGTLTADTGDFALYFPPLKSGDVDDQGAIRYVLVDESKVINVKVSKSGNEATYAITNIVEGETFNLDQAIELNIS